MGGVAELRHKVLALKPLRRVIGDPRFVAVGKRVAPRTDLVLQRLSGGRLAMSELAGLPFLVLHTVGRRSGLPQHVPRTRRKPIGTRAAEPTRVGNSAFSLFHSRSPTGALPCAFTLPSPD